MKAKPSIIATDDGSSTLFNETVGDHYHSINGAETESIHVFIDAGLKCFKSNNGGLNILEVGVGTGLNLCLSYKYCLSHDMIDVHYDALEPFPIDIEVADKLYFNVLDNVAIRQFYNTFHHAAWEVKIECENGFIIEKVKSSIQHFMPNRTYDLIYYDAFGPTFQAEMWNEEVITKVCSMMSENAVLVSYCAQGQFRRNLEKCGLKVERLPGPPGKREMIRAVK